METQTPNEQQYSGFWSRVAAIIIDGVILGTVTGILTIGDMKTGGPLAIFLAVLAAAISFFYGVLMECSAKQATVGKLILGIRVTDLNGNRISFLRSLARQSCKFFSFIILGLGYLFPLFTKKKQALHDMISGCVIIRKQTDF